MGKADKLLVAGIMVLALAACGLRTRVATAPAPRQSVSVDIVSRPQPPMGAAPGLNIPAIGPDGRRITPNRDLGPQEALWHVRMALNVAALGCRAGEGDAARANYNRLLAGNKAVLARTNAAIDADYRRRFGSQGVALRDKHNTRTYNFFALPPVQPAFCRAAAAVGREAAGMEAQALIAFAPTALARLEKPFFVFFDEYAAYQADLKRPRSQSVRIAAAAPAPQVKAVATKPAVRSASKASPVLETAKAGKPSGGFLVQLGAVASRDAARNEIKALAARHDELDGHPLVQSSADSKGRTVHRIAAAGFDSPAEAGRVCDALKAKGTACFVRPAWVG
jgi:cell division septation protein DedD